MDSRSMRLAARLAVIVGLAFLSCSLFVLMRYILTGRFSQGYLIWNLLLAALPVFIAWLTLGVIPFRPSQTRRGAAEQDTMPGIALNKSFGLALFAMWLIFYPNAPYLFTDFIHVVRRSGLGSVNAPWLSVSDLLWYDIVMNSAFAFVGHYLGLLSMYLMHGSMRCLFGRAAGWLMMAPAILLSGFGIHLGRFARFNSWDMLISPKETAATVLQSLKEPSAILFSFAFALFIALTYIIFYLFKKDESEKFFEPISTHS